MTMSGLTMPKTTPRRVILAVDYTVFRREVGKPPVAVEHGQEEYAGTVTHEIPGLMVRVKCDDGIRRDGRPSAVRPEEPS